MGKNPKEAITMARETGTTNAATAKAAGVEVLTGNPMAWVCLCKARQEGKWMKSTKAAEVPGMGCLVQTTTLEISEDGARRPIDALVWIPGVTLAALRETFSAK